MRMVGFICASICWVNDNDNDDYDGKILLANLMIPRRYVRMGECI
jgi:hypothetical protein